MKVCTKCLIEKPFTEFARHKLGRDGLRPRCKACTAVENRAYRTATASRRAAYNAAYRQAHREECGAYNRAWSKSHREACNAALSRYRERNRTHLKIAKALRRKLRSDKALAERVLQRVLLYGGSCFYCGEPADTIDHRIPICRGGSNLPANLVPACRSCNSRKRHRTGLEWKGVSPPSCPV